MRPHTAHTLKTARTCCTYLCITWDAYLGLFDFKGVEPKVFLHLTQGLHLPGRSTSKRCKSVSQLNVFEAWGWRSLGRVLVLRCPTLSFLYLVVLLYNLYAEFTYAGSLQTDPSKAKLRLVVRQLNWSLPLLPEFSVLHVVRVVGASWRHPPTGNKCKHPTFRRNSQCCSPQLIL